MKRNYLLYLTFYFLLISNSSIGQTKSASDFLNFTKQNFLAKSLQLKIGNWKIIQPTSSETKKAITTKTTLYGKEILSKQYYIILKYASSSETNTKVEKTTIELTSGKEFDKWVDELENLGYNFKKVTGQNGHLYSGEKGMMIDAGINNIEKSESEWTYEISIMIDNKFKIY